MEAKRLDMEGLLNASRQYRINTADKEDSVAWNLEEDITTSHRLALHHIAAQDAAIKGLRELLVGVVIGANGMCGLVEISLLTRIQSVLGGNPPDGVTR